MTSDYGGYYGRVYVYNGDPDAGNTFKWASSITEVTSSSTMPEGDVIEVLDGKYTAKTYYSTAADGSLSVGMLWRYAAACEGWTARVSCIKLEDMKVSGAGSSYAAVTPSPTGKAAVALVSLDHGAQLRDTYGQPVMDQLICFVANQWKKYFDIPGSQIVCRLTGTTFVVGCLDLDGGQLAEQMRNIYAEMPHECITSMGMMKRVPFTLSVAVAGLDELDSAANCWQRLYAICDERLRGIQISGGDKIC